MQSKTLELTNKGIQICNFCNGTNIVTDSITAETICTNCGVVYENSISDYEFEVKAHNAGVKSKANVVYSFSSTIIQNKNVDYMGNTIAAEQIHQINRLRRIDKFTGSDGNFERNLKEASYILGLLRDKLSLSDAITDSSYNRYIKILKSSMIKGRSIKAFIAASVYSACRDAKVPRTLKEIADAANVSRSLARKCYNMLIEKLDIDNNSNKVESNVYLARAANSCGLSNRTLLKSVEIWSKIKDNPVVSGKKPTALSMAILYYASILTGEKITKTKMADACNMSKVTLNKRAQEIEKLCAKL